jgi:hypothetical protein
MLDGTKDRAEGILFKSIPRWILLCIVGCILLAASFLLFWPLHSSLATWRNHRDTVFEGEAIQIPIGWAVGDSNHLLSLKKPGSTLLSGVGSEILIDPFAERHQNDLPLQRKLWLEGHGMKGSGKLMNPTTGSPVLSLPDIQCAQSVIASDKNVPMNISCLSSDSLLEYDFWGNEGDFPAFQSVCVQTMAIARRHPGTVRPK